MSTDTSKALETRRLRVWTLAQTLKSHGYAVEVAESEPLLAIPAAFSSPVLVRCDLRAICGGEPWFWFSDGGAIAPADDAHLHEVVVAVKGKLVGRAGG
jgi:hypothetical protein